MARWIEVDRDCGSRSGVWRCKCLSEQFREEIGYDWSLNGIVERLGYILQEERLPGMPDNRLPNASKRTVARCENLAEPRTGWRWPVEG